MRNGLGALFLLSGMLLLGLMALASSGKLVLADAAAWARIFFSHFLITTTAPIIYVGLRSWSSGKLEAQGLIDALIGLMAYIGAFTMTVVLIRTFRINPWWSLWPGFVVTWYGFRLRRGKQFPAFELR